MPGSGKIQIDVEFVANKASAKKAIKSLGEAAKWGPEQEARFQERLKAAHTAKPVSQLTPEQIANRQARIAANEKLAEAGRARRAGLADQEPESDLARRLRIVRGGGGNPPQLPLAKATAGSAAGGSFIGSLVGTFMGTVIAHVGVKILQVALKMLADAIKHLSREAERIAKLAAGAFLNNRPSGYATMTNAIGKSFGVGEREAMTLAMAVDNLTDKFKVSSQTIAQLMPVMTDLHVKTSAMWQSWDALKTWMESAFAPMLRIVADSFRVMFDTLQRSYLWDAFRKILELAVIQISALTVAFTLSVSAMQIFTNAIGDFVAYLLDRAVALATLGYSDKKGWTGNTPMMSQQTKDMIKNLGTLGRNVTLPQNSGANRMQGSAWEKMGLVLGIGANNPVKETAQNTKRTAQLLEQILKGTPRSGKWGEGSMLAPQP